MRLLISFLLIAAMAQAQTWREMDVGIGGGQAGVNQDSDASTTLNDSVSRYGFCGVYTNSANAPRSIRNIGWRTHWTVNRAGGSGMVAAIQNPQAGVGTPYRPDNVDIVSVAIPNASIPAVNTIHETAALSADHTATPGDIFCVNLRWDALGRQGTDSVSISNSSDICLGSGVVRWIASAWDTGQAARLGFIYFRHSDGSLGYFIPSVVSTFTGPSVNLNSTPDEYALHVNLPYAVRVRGADIGVLSALMAAFDFVIYDNTNTAILTRTVPSHGHTNNRVWVSFPEITIPANQSFRFSIRPSSATGMNLPYNIYPHADQMNLPGQGGSGFSMSTRTNLGAWTEWPLRRPRISLNMHRIQDGGSAGPTPASFPIQ